MFTLMEGGVPVKTTFHSSVGKRVSPFVCQQGTAMRVLSCCSWEEILFTALSGRADFEIWLL